ncbi:glucoamylase family protein [Homoserinibacter sp. GY 40078]|uniref:glucoamylase family protein n=1 Tax=Homoserinibacter sp. GY 40078 TaxID=2603275 RepID=UPI0011CA71B2|nr:glucoamylase family protein [Homoserinibacter sp. GY 40078]TXK20007.1 DUF3131 domain-containing protein [Homoserinibacter sp. GY 40078]
MAVAATTLGCATPPSAGHDERRTLLRYASDTWESLTAMTDPDTGLPADNIDGDLAHGSASAYTSPTNIGGYLWSTVVARDLGIINRHEARERMTTTLSTLSTLERNEASGMYFNWYSPTDGHLLTEWPDSGDPVFPFLSSVDNGWLAAGLRVVAEAEPALEAEANELVDSMDFGAFFDPEPTGSLPAGTNRGGFWEEPPGETCAVQAPNYNGTGPEVYYTCHHYDTTVSESRIATYLAIGDGRIPATSLYGTYRTMPDGCDWSWQEQRPIGETREYSGLSVFEGAYQYDELAFVPGWGGSMFEALMPDLFVPEAEWGPDSWGLNHPITVEVQERHGDDAGYGYWGFSPASNPEGGYREYGVDLAGIRSDGYLSDTENTDVDIDYTGCKGAEGTNPDPEFGDGVVTPHASFLALEYDADAVLENLRGIEKDLGAYGAGGFYDAVAVHSGTIAERYLSLDQSMIMGAIGNHLRDGMLRTYFVDDDLEARLRPVIEQQRFSASWDTTD